LPTMQMRGWWF